MFEEYQKETNIKDKTDEDKKVELIMSYKTRDVHNQ